MRILLPYIIYCSNPPQPTTPLNDFARLREQQALHDVIVFHISTFATCNIQKRRAAAPNRNARRSDMEHLQLSNFLLAGVSSLAVTVITNPLDVGLMKHGRICVFYYYCS